MDKISPYFEKMFFFAYYFQENYRYWGNFPVLCPAIGMEMFAIIAYLCA